MKRSLLIAIGIIAVLAAMTVWWFSPIQTVKRSTKSLLSVMSFEADTGTAGRQLRRYRLERLLADEVVISSPTEADGTFRREELDSGYAWLASRVKRSDFSVDSWQDVSAANDQVTVTAVVDGSMEYSGMQVLQGLHDVTLVWRNTQDHWRLVSVQWTSRE